MFLKILPDLLRGSITTIFITVLFFVLSRPKFKPRLYILSTIFVTIVDTFICSLFYKYNNYTGVVYYSFGIYVLLVIIGKMFFKDKILQWCFNCVTVLNVYLIVVVISYYLSGLFPHPMYAVTLIRIAMLTVIIFIFHKYLRPLYMEVSENWGAFLLPTVGIFIGFFYIILSLGDVETSMRNNLVYFCILTLVALLTYLAIIFSLKSLQQKYALREENLKRKANEAFLISEIDAQESFLSAAKQNRHDLRHHNAILAEYLNNNDVVGAKEYLNLYDGSIAEGSLKEFSKNPTANALFRLYDRRASEIGIDYSVRSEADEKLACSHTDTAVMLSNIFENALEACKKCKFSEKHLIYSSTIQNGNILIEIKNSVDSSLIFKNGFPLSTKTGGGTGLLSVKNIVKKYNGMVDFSQKGYEFITRILFLDM